MAGRMDRMILTTLRLPARLEAALTKHTVANLRVQRRAAPGAAPTDDKAAHARPFWNAATRHGTPEATTTFHNQHDKRDYRYSYGQCGEFVRQEGKRGLALGYLTKVRFARFLSMPLAAELTGLDLTRPGRSAEQASRVVVVAEEFFELLVRYSRSHPFRDGDYGKTKGL